MFTVGAMQTEHMERRYRVDVKQTECNINTLNKGICTYYAEL